MDTPVSCLSSQLLAANRRLHELRSQAQAQRQAVGDRHSASQHQCLVRDTIGDCLLPTDDNAIFRKLPDHLGWGSDVVTAVLRRQRQGTCLDEEPQDGVVCLQETAVTKTSAAIHNCKTISSKNNPQSAINSLDSDGWVKLYPAIGLGMLQQELTAPGRLWLMLRYLNREGSGKLRIDSINEHLTTQSSTLHLCGKRQLRNLLQTGEGVYWARDKEHIWLRSAAKVAFALGVERLSGQPIVLPVAVFLDGIGSFRAHLYAAFHSSRTKETSHGIKAMPIARDTLSRISGVGRSSQRAYEARVGLAVQANFAVGDLSKKESQEEKAWKQGQALFELKDFCGQQGKKGKMYLAWQLPNSYGSCHSHAPKGRQRRINRQLKDLVIKRAPGNNSTRLDTRYVPDGKQAVNMASRHPEWDVYWWRQRTRNGSSHLWQQIQ